MRDMRALGGHPYQPLASYPPPGGRAVAPAPDLPDTLGLEGADDELAIVAARGRARHGEGLVPADFAKRLGVPPSMTCARVRYGVVSEREALALQGMTALQYLRARRLHRREPSLLQRLTGGGRGGDFGLGDLRRVVNPSRTGETSLDAAVARMVRDSGAGRQGRSKAFVRVVSLSRLSDLAADIGRLLPEWDEYREVKPLVADALRIAFAEGQREECLERASITLRKASDLVASARAATNSKDPGAETARAVDILLEKVDEQISRAATYGNLFVLDAKPSSLAGGHAKVCEYIEIVARLRKGASSRLADQGAVAAWVRGNPQVRALEQEILASGIEARALADMLVAGGVK